MPPKKKGKGKKGRFYGLIRYYLHRHGPSSLTKACFKVYLDLTSFSTLGCGLVFGLLIHVCKFLCLIIDLTRN